jgi:crotonobetainyl-CoA:carnitine CoA-transferase CaiB-like acyl-CoA transferase
VLLDGLGATLESPPPALGQHSRSLLAALGLDETTIEALIRQGVVAG